MNLIFKKEIFFLKNVIFWDILVVFLKYMLYLLKSYIKFCIYIKLLYVKWYIFSGSFYICSLKNKEN